MLTKKKILNVKNYKCFWFLFISKKKMLVSNSYRAINFFFKYSCFLKDNFFFLSLKIIFSVILKPYKKSFFFFCNNFIYLKSIKLKPISLTPGCLTNIKLINFESLHKSIKSTSIAIILSSNITSSFLHELKIKNFIIIGFNSINTVCSGLVDFPLYLNSESFFVVYFFNLFIFKIINDI